MFILFMTLMSFGISAQSIGDTIILKAGAKLRNEPRVIGKQIKYLKENTIVILLKKGEIPNDDYYYIITEDKDEGYINEVWLMFRINDRTPMQMTNDEYGTPDDINEYKNGDYHSITYIYNCAGGKYRNIEFIKTSKGWKKESEHISNCIK